MDWQDRWAGLVEALRIVHDESQKERLVGRIREYPTTVGFVNAHAMNLATRNDRFASELLACDVLLRDGSGMATLLSMLGRAPGLNMNGTDFIPEVLRAYRGRSIALLGSGTEVLAEAARVLERDYDLDVRTTAHGFEPAEAYARFAREPDHPLIVLAMGMPKQERVAAILRSAGYEGSILCGGAILDFLSGSIPRAPGLLRAVGLEWLFRLAREPRRLFGRYVVGNPAFLWRAWRFRRTREARSDA